MYGFLVLLLLLLLLLLVPGSLLACHNLPCDGVDCDDEGDDDDDDDGDDGDDDGDGVIDDRVYVAMLLCLVEWWP